MNKKESCMVDINFIDDDFTDDRIGEIYQWL